MLAPAGAGNPLSRAVVGEARVTQVSPSAVTPVRLLAATSPKELSLPVRLEIVFRIACRY